MLTFGRDNFYKLAIYLYQHKALDERNSQAWVGALTAFLLPSPPPANRHSVLAPPGPRRSLTQPSVSQRRFCEPRSTTKWTVSVSSGVLTAGAETASHSQTQGKAQKHLKSGDKIETQRVKKKRRF